MTVRLTIAREYHRDARHFLRRFSLLPPQEFDKMGRVKNFVDLYMAAECALKAHVFAGRSNESALELYRKVRQYGGHRLTELAGIADYLDDRGPYESIQRRFAGFSVSLRYSIDAWDTFFPFGLEDGGDQYDQTVANPQWIQAAKDEVHVIIESLSERLTVVIEGLDVKRLIEHQEAMKSFVKEAKIRKTD
jgi:hypothetical protein